MGRMGRVSEFLLPENALFPLLFFLFVRLPDIDHIAEYLHAYIILHFGLMFNKRNKIAASELIMPAALLGKQHFSFSMCWDGCTGIF